jgi:molybdopterin molybdotransferase
MTDHHHHDHHHAGEMLEVHEVRSRILDSIKPLEPVELPLEKAWGCVLVEDAKSPYDIPTFASSAMDGFAIRSSDTTNAPATLRLVGSAFIGKAPNVSVGSGEAVWIATGAPIPEGADAVAPKEDCEAGEDTVEVLTTFEAGNAVRPPGQDLKAGDVVVPAGRVLLGPELGMLSTAGFPAVKVYPKARVCVVATGDELVEPGQVLETGQIPDANSFTIFGCLRELGIDPLRTGVIPDDETQLAEVFRTYSNKTDCFISSGGMSVGDLDVVKKVVTGMGRIDSYKVAMQPGMPQAFGELEGKPYFGLPGNPVSVFVCFELFLRPALLKMMGRGDLDRPKITAIADEELEGLPNRDRYTRVRADHVDGQWHARVTGPPSSHLLGGVVKANGLAIVPKGTSKIEAGDKVEVLLFRPPGQ